MLPCVLSAAPGRAAEWSLLALGWLDDLGSEWPVTAAKGRLADAGWLQSMTATWNAFRCWQLRALTWGSSMVVEASILSCMQAQALQPAASSLEAMIRHASQRDRLQTYPATG
jgi:hypothetical protein